MYKLLSFALVQIPQLMKPLAEYLKYLQKSMFL